LTSLLSLPQAPSAIQVRVFSTSLHRSLLRPEFCEAQVER